MNISILTVGSRGDVQPFLALAIGLKEAGHNVKFGANIEFKDFIEKRGIEFHTIRDNPMDALKDENKKLTSKEKGKLYYNYMTNWILDGLKTAKNTDLLIFTPVYHVGYHVSEKLNIPCIKCSYSPFSPTNEFPNPYLGIRPKFLNKISYTAYNAVEWMIIKNNINQLREELLGLEPIAFPGMLSRLNKEKVPIVYGFSENVVPKPKDWSEWVKVTGYWFLKDLDNYTPSEDLKNFLNNGSKPLFFDIGSLGVYSEKIIQKLLSVLLKTNYRIVANPGGADVSNLKTNDKIYFVDGSVPHVWILPKVQAVISHGGPGTVAAVLRAGKPLTIVPTYGDHKFWAKRVHDLGVGTPPLVRSKLNDEIIIKTVDELMNSELLKKNADELGKKIRNEKGVGKAIEIIENYLSKAKI